MDSTGKRLWQVLTVLPTDYSYYGGEVVRWSDPSEPDADCSCGCRWAIFLEDSGDWLVCTKTEWYKQLPYRSRAWLWQQPSPRAGLLTWEHQAGRGCFDWACCDCGEDADSCRCDD